MNQHPPSPPLECCRSLRGGKEPDRGDVLLWWEYDVWEINYPAEEFLSVCSPGKTTALLTYTPAILSQRHMDDQIWSSIWRGLFILFRVSAHNFPTSETQRSIKQSMLDKVLKAVFFRKLKNSAIPDRDEQMKSTTRRAGKSLSESSAGKLSVRGRVPQSHLINNAAIKHLKEV